MLMKKGLDINKNIKPKITSFCNFFLLVNCLKDNLTQVKLFNP